MLQNRLATSQPLSHKFLKLSEAGFHAWRRAATKLARKTQGHNQPGITNQERNRLEKVNPQNHQGWPLFNSTGYRYSFDKFRIN